MRLPNSAHTSRPWRIHELTPDFKLEDVWALPTPGGPDNFPRLVQLITSGRPSDRASAPPARSLRSAGRWSYWLGPPGRRRWRPGADAPRPVDGGSARCPIRPGLRRAPLHVALPARRRVGGGDRRPDRTSVPYTRLGSGPRRRLPQPDGRSGEAKRAARHRLHGRDHAVPAPDCVPDDDAERDRTRLAPRRASRHQRTPDRGFQMHPAHSAPGRHRQRPLCAGGTRRRWMESTVRSML